MLALIVTLKDESKIDKVMEALVECAIYNAAVLDGEAVENLATRTLPLLSSLGGLFGTDTIYTRTIVAAVEQREQITEFIAICAADGVDFRSGDTGWVMALPCEVFVGNRDALA